MVSLTTISMRCPPVISPSSSLYHGYPWLICRLTCPRTNHKNIHLRGYKKDEMPTTPFHMVERNDLDRFHLAGDVINRAPKLGYLAAYAKQAMRDKLIEQKHSITRRMGASRLSDQIARVSHVPHFLPCSHWRDRCHCRVPLPNRHIRDCSNSALGRNSCGGRQRRYLSVAAVSALRSFLAPIRDRTQQSDWNLNLRPRFHGRWTLLRGNPYVIAWLAMAKIVGQR